MITDWTGTPVVNDRLYITFLPIKFYSYPIIVHSEIYLENFEKNVKS
jgi:hypothetical protein